MAVVAHEDAPARIRAAASPRTAATLKLLVWIAAAFLPWAAIAVAVKAVISG